MTFHLRNCFILSFICTIKDGKTKIIDFNRNTTQKSSNKHFCLTILVQKSNFSAFGESKIPEAALYFPRVCSNLSHNICKLNAEHSIPWHKLRSLMCYWLQTNQTVFLYYNRIISLCSLNNGFNTANPSIRLSLWPYFSLGLFKKIKVRFFEDMKRYKIF